jgi:hypothetical protein
MNKEILVKFVLPLLVILITAIFVWFGKIGADAWVWIAGPAVGAPLTVEGLRDWQNRRLQTSAMSLGMTPPVPLEPPQ